MDRAKKFALLALLLGGAAIAMSRLADAAGTRLDTLNVKGATTIGGAASIAGTTTAAAINASGNVGVAGTLGVTGAATFRGTVAVSGAAAHAVMSVNSSANVTGIAPGTAGNVLVSDGTDWSSGSVSSTLPTSYNILNAGLKVVANPASAHTLVISLTQSDGSTDPASGSGAVIIPFRNATSATGSVTGVSVTSALSVTVSSGATLGTANGVAQLLYVWALNNAGTAELEVSGSNVFDESTVQTSTTMSNAADSGAVLYGTTGRSSKAVRLLGTILITETTAGTWDSGATTISMNTRRVHENKAAESSAKTPTGSDQYQQMTTNSITVTPGVWTIHGKVYFDVSGGAANYADTWFEFCTANGADSGSEPANISASGSITMLGGNTAINRLGRNTITGRAEVSSTDIPVLIQVTSTVTIFIVPFSSQITSTNARIYTSIWAERLQ